jgi:hypothetical protein
VIDAWHELSSDDDVADLMKRFGGFHDGCIREMFVWSNYYVSANLRMGADWGENVVNVRIHFQRQWAEPSSIEMWFEDITDLHLQPAAKNYDWIIYDATLMRRDGVVYWAKEAGFDPQTCDRTAWTWIGARRVRWRAVNDWMGDALHYGPAAQT